MQIYDPTGHPSAWAPHDNLTSFCWTSAALLGDTACQQVLHWPGRPLQAIPSCWQLAQGAAMLMGGLGSCLLGQVVG